MKKLAIMAVFAAIASCSRHAASPPVSVVPPEIKLPANCSELSVNETEALVKAKPGLVILDMRVETEWAEEGHIGGAQFANYFRGGLKDYLAALDRTKPCLVYCAIGERSRLTAVELAQLGFREIYLLKGGLNAWKAAGKPVVK